MTKVKEDWWVSQVCQDVMLSGMKKSLKVRSDQLKFKVFVTAWIVMYCHTYDKQPVKAQSNNDLQMQVAALWRSGYN